MPLGFQVVPGLDLRGFHIYFKTWSKCASGQIATSTGSFLSRKCLTGDFLSLEIFFWFLLLIALSGQFLLNDQYGDVMLVSESGVGSLVHSALLIQHPLEISGKTSSGG